MTVLYSARQLRNQIKREINKSPDHMHITPFSSFDVLLSYLRVPPVIKEDINNSEKILFQFEPTKMQAFKLQVIKRDRLLVTKQGQ